MKWRNECMREGKGVLAGEGWMFGEDGEGIEGCLEGDRENK